MNKNTKAIAFALTALFSTQALGKTVTYQYDNGVKRTVNCQDAFYVFANDPKREKWLTCDGFEAIDIPLVGNKNDPNNRDSICSNTDRYNPERPISINDPRAKQARQDFSDANITALIHASKNHEESVAIGILMRAKLGVDIFKEYKDMIRRPYAGEKADGAIPLLNKFTKKIEKTPYVWQSGWGPAKANKSAYRDVRKLCM